MIVLIKDDGKHISKSYQARVRDVELRGFGDSPDEAALDLRRKLEKLTDQINDLNFDDWKLE